MGGLDCPGPTAPLLLWPVTQGLPISTRATLPGGCGNSLPRPSCPPVCTRSDPLSCPSLCTPRLIGTRCPSTLLLAAFSQGFPRSPFTSQVGRRFVFMSHKSNLPVSHLPAYTLPCPRPHHPHSPACSSWTQEPLAPHPISPSTSTTVLAEPAISKRNACCRDPARASRLLD